MESIFQILSLSPPGWGSNLLQGLLSTIEIALGAYIFGLVLGFCGAFGKLYGGRITKLIFEIYTTVFRAVPELVLILMLYYLGTDLLNTFLTELGYEQVDISGLWAGIYVLGFVQGAYSTEVLRGAIQAVPRGQIEAATACGMNWFTRQRRIIIPAMIPLALPGMTNLWMIVTKDTALLAVVGFSELTLQTRQAAGATKAYLLLYVAAAVLYLILTFGSNIIFNLIERRYRRGQGARV